MASTEDEVKRDGSKSMDPVGKKPKAEKIEKADKPAKVKSDAAAEKPLKGEAPDDPVVPVAPKVMKAAPKDDAPLGAKTATETPLSGELKPAKSRDVRGIVIKVAAAVIGVVAVVVIVFGVLIYGYKSENPAVKAVAVVVPYPVERVNGHFVTYNQYLFEVDANKRAYQNNAKLNNQPAVDFNSAEGKKLVVQIKQHALDKLKSDALTAQLAAQKKVKVTDKEVNDLVDQLYQRYGGKDTLLKTLKSIYGWNLNDLKAVVYKQLLAKNLEEKITSDPAMDAAAKAKAQAVVKEIKDGGDFAELAKKNSQASDASSGGDLGFFTKGQLPDELQKAAEALQPGQVSDPIKDQYGYEVIKVVEKKDDGSIHAQHILIKTVDYNEYFQGELKKAKVNVYIKA